MLTTPVILFIFNRPSLTQKVFDVIRQVKPSQLLIVADGPRSQEELKLCKQARKIVKQVDWECEVLKNYSDINLGCRCRVSSGLNWAFHQVEEAIILEDDCLPDPSFFCFSQKLLEYYRNDCRVMHIAGANFVSDQISIPYSYYFSHYFSIWGWATWRRAWQHYDPDIKDWFNQKQSSVLENLYENPDERKGMEKILTAIHKNRIDTWDYQWSYTCRLQSGLAVIPARNLISNIGFGKEASRTRSNLDPRANLPTSSIWEIQHPPHVFQNKMIDQFRYEKHFKDTCGESILRKKFNSLKHKFSKASHFLGVH